MRFHVRQFVKVISQIFDFKEPIYEFGSRQVTSHSHEDLRILFKGREYVGVDMIPGPGVDRIENIEHLTLNEGVAGSILMLDTLEHVKGIHQAMKECIRVLAEDGIITISIPMLFPIHSFPHDYWRLTPDGMKALLERFPCKVIAYHGYRNLPHTVYGIAFKIEPDLIEDKVKRLNKMYKQYCLIRLDLLTRLRIPFARLVGKQAFYERRYVNDFKFWLC
ncbi:MAG: methyltransferase domain-containing protein [Candidatus Hodarchaeota archaeon]